MEQSDGDEVRGGEDFEVALGGVVAFGAIDDGLAGGVPSDRVKRLRLTRFSLSRRGVDSGDGSDATLGEAEADSKGVLEGGGGGVEEEGE